MTEPLFLFPLPSTWIIAYNSENLTVLSLSWLGKGFMCMLANWEKVFYVAPYTCCPYYMDYSSLDLGASSEQWVITHTRLPWGVRCRQPYPEHQLCLSSLSTNKAKAQGGILPLCKEGALPSKISYLKTYLVFDLFGWDLISFCRLCPISALKLVLHCIT